jgi:mRNA-degrading endonuclease RelE of RelBE toxin-antitoxin system
MRRLDGTISRRIRAKVLQAATDPERFSLRLVNSPYRRIQVGDWRVIIHVDRRELQVVVVEVAHRRGAYR